MNSWSEKVCIITGSSLGIGKELAIEIGKLGGKVVLNARNAQRLEETRLALSKEGIELMAHAGDISNYSECTALVNHVEQTFGRIDVLINNAGISADGFLEEFNPEIFQKVVNVNLMGSVYMTQAALSHLKETKGSVFFIGSVAGIHGLPGHAAYSSSKMALTALAESLKIELQGSGVHVGIAYVGFTENDPQKTIYNKNGEIIPQPSRGVVKAEPVEKVAHRIMSMIERRRFKLVFTPTGKLFSLLNRFIPRLLLKILMYGSRRRK